MAFTYPAPINTPWKKVQYIFRLKEYVRLMNNFAAYWWHNGLTQDQYDNGMDAADFDPRTARLYGSGITWFVMNSQLKNKYAYTAQITEQAYRNFADIEWEPRLHVIEDEIAAHVKAQSLVDTHDNLLDLDIL